MTSRTCVVAATVRRASSVSTTEYTAFGILGRVTAAKQTTDGVEYATGYTYTLSGALIEETYPSGRAVKNTLDADGSLSQVQSLNANDMRLRNTDYAKRCSTGYIFSFALRDRL
ncbi:MAG: hypothetical protein R2682_12930 [Pyrinomonadaceae bacterium]